MQYCKNWTKSPAAKTCNNPPPSVQLSNFVNVPLLTIILATYLNTNCLKSLIQVESINSKNEQLSELKFLRQDMIHMNMKLPSPLNLADSYDFASQWPFVFFYFSITLPPHRAIFARSITEVGIWMTFFILPCLHVLYALPSEHFYSDFKEMITGGRKLQVGGLTCTPLLFHFYDFYPW